MHMSNTNQTNLKVQQGDSPDATGMYIVFTESPIGDDFTDRKLLMFMKGDTPKNWWYPGSDQSFRGTIYGYIGPLPILKKSNFKKRPTKKFAVGTYPDAAHGAFLHGPFDSIKEACEIDGEEDGCIVRLLANKEPKVIRIWENGEWVKWTD